jgi:hypothetical protein
VCKVEKKDPDMPHGDLLGQSRPQGAMGLTAIRIRCNKRQQMSETFFEFPLLFFQFLPHKD